MKTIFYILSFALLASTGCNNQSASTNDVHEHGDGSMHTHENGEVHQSHDTIVQEEFTVSQDSSIHNHEHNGDSTHSHSH